MGILDLFLGEPKKGFYLNFRCLKCNAKIVSKIHTNTLSLLKASIKEPEFCGSCGNRTQFRYGGVEYY